MGNLNWQPCQDCRLRDKKKKESEVAQSCLTVCDPMDCSIPGFSVHGIFQARVLEWGAISFSRGSSRPSEWTWFSHTAGRCFTLWASREALKDRGDTQRKSLKKEEGGLAAKAPCKYSQTLGRSEIMWVKFWHIVALSYRNSSQLMTVFYLGVLDFSLPLKYNLGTDSKGVKWYVKAFALYSMKQAGRTISWKPHSMIRTPWTVTYTPPSCVTPKQFT